MDTRFHCVYLLTSLDPQCAGEYYIGYTVDPIRRLRQHNGEIVSGAWRTKRRGRPWELLCCVSGFGEDRIALKFEWCWQHPTKSTRLKTQMTQLRGVHRLPYAVGVLHLLLRADLFARLQLTLHIFEPERVGRVVAELQGRVPSISPLVATSLLRIEEITKERFMSLYLDGVSGGDGTAGDGCVYFVTAPLSSQPDVDAPSRRVRSCRYLSEEDVFRQHARVKELLEANQCPCALCSLPLRSPYFVRCYRTPFCALRAHLACLAMWFTYETMQKRDVTMGQSTRNERSGEYSNKIKDDSNDGTMDAHASGRQLHSLSVNNADFSSSRDAGSILDSSGHISAFEESRCASSPSLTLLPCQPCPCPLCDEPLQWGALVHDLKRRAVLEKRWMERQRREKIEAALAERLQRLQDSSLTERKSRRKATPALGQKRNRGEYCGDTVGDGGKEAVTNWRARAMDGCDSWNDTNDFSHSVSLPPSRDEGYACDSSRRGVGGSKHTTRMTDEGKNDSITDICDCVLQLTEFNLDEWLDA
ncbi:hypothetical protein ECC02_004969 [Trypanosoma cruzi]|uniref:Structure-specific endonuclease subunit SLX1 homolog n=1 Tax=Trypanosoma cruzi TaxID=5693 RepID=A0A7J6Y795_TRYCR|nr:hypothetical protein ECC02_004969 [Trypanosoma cruzi]